MTKQVVYRPHEFCAQYGVGITKMYDLIKAGALDARKAGRCTLITAESAEQWFASLEKISPAEAA